MTTPAARVPTSSEATDNRARRFGRAIRSHTVIARSASGRDVACQLLEGLIAPSHHEREEIFMTATSTTTDIDGHIQSDVLAELKWDARVAPNEIGVTVKKGIVTLMGSVDSYVKRWAAEEAALRVRGVRGVANDIEVKLPGFDERTDADIAAAAVNALKWDVIVPVDKIQVTVAKGWITLNGEVEWQFQKTAAERAVRNLTGTRGVSNLITVAPRVKPSALEKKIEEALLRSVKTDAERIQVDVPGSKVILKGTVRSAAEKNEAATAAWSAPGVTSVDNQIVVSYY
jgi:osmotically-inducible protein OsmY